MQIGLLDRKLSVIPKVRVISMKDHQRVSIDLVERLAKTLEEIGYTGGHGNSFQYNLRALLNYVDVHKARTTGGKA